MRRLLLLLICLFIPRIVEATTRFVSPSGSGSTCSTGSPCSVSTALSATAAGDTVRFKSGTYTSAVDLSSITNGTSYSNAVTFDTESGAGTVIIQPSSGGTVLTITNSRAYFIIKDLIVDGRNINSSGQSNMRVSNGANHIRFSNVETRNNTLNNPGTFPGAGAIIEQGDDIEWLGGSSHDNGNNSTAYPFNGDQAPYGFYWHGLRGIIRGVAIYNNGAFGVHAYSGAGDSIDDMEISGNTLHGNGNHYFGADSLNTRNSSAILANSGRRYLIFNNLVYSSPRQEGVSVRSPDSLVYNNTLVGVRVGVYAADLADNLVVKNNAIQATGNNLFKENTPDYNRTPTGTSYSNNLCAVATAGTYNVACNTIEAASTTYINASSDWHLKAGSAAINGGVTPPCAATDISGVVTRPQDSACDIGAYEFSSITPANTVAVTGITSPGVFLHTGVTATTSASTVGLNGTDQCTATANSVQWANTTNSTNGTASGGTGTGAQTWTAGGITLTANRVNTINFTVNCSDLSTAGTSILVRANGADALVGEWGFNENTGTTVNDETANNFDLTFAGTGNTWVTGKYGSAVNLNGSGWLTATHDNKMDFSLLTLEAWVMATVSSSTFNAIVASDNSPGYTYFLYATAAGYCGNGTPAGGIYSANLLSYTIVCDGTPLSINVWHHIAVTHDGINTKFYVDGNPTPEQTLASFGLPLEWSGTNLLIGKSPFGENFVGRIDEIRIYNYARTGAQIATDAATAIGAPPPGSPANLTVGADAVIIYGADASVTIGAQ